MSSNETPAPPRDDAADPDEPQPIDVPVLFEDEDLVVASKPPLLQVHRSHQSTDRVFLLQELKRKVERRLFPVHRLDRAASGVIAMAYSSEAARELQASLSSDDAIKEYLVLVRGETPERGEIDRQLTDRKVGVKKDAFTSYERIATFSRCSLVRARIKTGRHRQIRRHFAHLAHQVIGCTHHGKGKINRHFREEYGLPRLFLHAARLDIRHPTQEGRLVVEAPLWPDLREFLLRLPDVDRDLVDTL
ncbi:MAG: pseudouridine synthase [Planctomycetota bacterium]